MNVLVFDIGGTEIKYGVIDSEENLVFQDKFLTNSSLGGEHILNVVLDKISEIKDQFNIIGVGLSSCGVIDVLAGKVKYANDIIKGYTNTLYCDLIFEKFNLPASIENDVNCFALGEGYFGAARDNRNYITLTIGTGVGGAIVIDRKIYHGLDYSAGEIGQMRILNNIKFETLASMSSLVTAAKEHNLNVNNGIDVFNLYDANNLVAKDVVSNFYHYLAMGITNIAYIFNPEKIIIGGGISNRPTFLSELNQKIEIIVDPHYFGSSKIEIAKLKNQGGMFGAFVVFKNKYPEFFE